MFILNRQPKDSHRLFGFPVSMVALGFHDTLRRVQFYYLNIWDQMITPCRHLNQSDDMRCITQPVEKRCWHHKIKQARRPSSDALGQYTNLGKLAPHKQHRSRTHAEQLTQAKTKQALHEMRLMKASVLNHDCLFVFMYAFIGPTLGWH